MQSDVPDGWRHLPLPEVIDFREGPGIMARDFRDSGIPLIRLAGLSGGPVLEGCNYLAPDLVERKWAHLRVQVGDTLLSTSASLGRVARVDQTADGAVPYTGIIRMRPKDARVEAEFIPYLLAAPHFESQVEAMGAGSVMRHFGPSHLRGMTLVVPPPADQRRIAAILGALDDKIVDNRRLSATLEETASELFRASFVHFVSLTDLAVSDVRPMPPNSKVGALGDLVDIEMGQSPPGISYTDDPSAGLPLIQGMGDFGERYPKTTRYTTAPKKRAMPGSTLMTVRAPVGEVNVGRDEVCIGRGVAAISSPFPAFTEFLVRSLKSQWASHESGTIFSAVNRKQILGLPVVVPDHAAIAQYEELVRPFVELRGTFHDETATLTMVRDALLPKLVSGAIRVPDPDDVDEVIEPALELAAGCP